MTLVPTLKQPRELLNQILDHPELPAIIQSLDAPVLTRLIRHVGLEDSAEIVSLATADQLKSIFDEICGAAMLPVRRKFLMPSASACGWKLSLKPARHLPPAR